MDQAVPDSTCWTLIRGAVAGNVEHRESFVNRYTPVVAAYLKARWKAPGRHQEIPDASQEVFFECFRAGGALDRVESGRSGGFRAYLFGVVRNVARMAEARWRRQCGIEVPVEGDLDAEDGEDSPSRAFDRAWAKTVLREAAELQESRALAEGDKAVRRVELLRLRFNDGVPIREIASRWNTDPAVLHHEYARARKDYRDALRTVLKSYHPDSPESFAREWARLEDLLRT